MLVVEGQLHATVQVPVLVFLHHHHLDLPRFRSPKLRVEQDLVVGFLLYRGPLLHLPRRPVADEFAFLLVPVARQ